MAYGGLQYGVLELGLVAAVPRAPGGEINQPLPNPFRQWLRERYRSRSF